MAKESDFQGKVAKWLRSKGCYVLVTTVQAGVPEGCPDVIALLDGGGWVGIECKKDNPYRKDGIAKKGAFRPLQLPTISRLDKMYYCRVAWPDNWAGIRKELEDMI